MSRPIHDWSPISSVGHEKRCVITALEEKLVRYTARSSNTEQEKQERAQSMIRAAVDRWSGFDSITVSLLPKGSYANNTNVRRDSDVDIAVIHEGLYYYDDSALHEADKVGHTPVTAPHFDGRGYRRELEAAMCDAYKSECDTTGTTAIEISENSGRVKADVVPSFRYHLYEYDAQGTVVCHEGTKTWRTDNTWVVNFPQQQYDNGVYKNDALRTGRRYKKIVRILKRVENDLVAAGTIEALPSYFMECLVYRAPNTRFNQGGVTPLTDDLTNVVAHIWSETKEGGSAKDWKEPNNIKPLFGPGQKWSMADAHNLALQTFESLGLGNK